MDDRDGISTDEYVTEDIVDTGYSDIDISELPAWWRDAIDHFRERGIDPYYPPQFRDGVIGPSVVKELERELDVDIELRCENPSIGDAWTVRVDGEPVAQIGRHRSRDRYTVYEVSADEFRELVRSSVPATD